MLFIITSSEKVILQTYMHPEDGSPCWLGRCGRQTGSFGDEDGNWSLKLKEPMMTEEHVWHHKGYKGICLSFESFNLLFPSLQCLISWQPDELAHYALFRSKHFFAFHSIHKYVLASTLVPFGGSEGQSAPCPSPGFWGVPAVVGMPLVPWLVPV